MTTYYFADNQTGAHPSAAVGSNSNAGTSSSAPKRNTEGFNFNSLVAGDQVLFAIGGCWIRSDGNAIVNCERSDALDATNPVIFGTYDPGGGVSGKPWLKCTSGSAVMTFGAFNGSPTGVYRGGFIVRGLRIDGQDVADIVGIRWWSNHSNITVEDCDIQDCHVGNDLHLGPDSTGDLTRFFHFRRNYLTGNAFTGWLGAGNDILIEKNTFEANGSNNALHHGIYYGAGSPTAEHYRVVIRHNTFANNNSAGGVLSGGHLTFRGRLNYSTVEDNLVYSTATSMTGNSYAISHFAAYSSAEHHDKTIIRGNRTYNIPVGIYFSSAPGIVIENNVHVDLTSGYTARAGGIVGVDGGSGLNSDSGDGQAKIRNNSIYFANGRPGMEGVCIQQAAGTGISVDNNVVIYGSIESGSPYAFSLTEAGGVTYTSIRNNFIGGAYLGWHSGYTSLSSFQTHFDGLSGTDCSGNVENATHGLTTPTLANNLNMNATSSASPVVNAALAGITKLAVSGYARETNRDMGAFEYGRNP